MKMLWIALVFSFPFLALAGGSSGGGGVRPEIAMFSSVPGFPSEVVDAQISVKLIRFNSDGSILFAIRDGRTEEVNLFQDDLDKLSSDVQNAVEKSIESGNWESARSTGI